VSLADWHILKERILANAISSSAPADEAWVCRAILGVRAAAPPPWLDWAAAELECQIAPERIVRLLEVEWSTASTFADDRFIPIPAL